MTRYSGVITTRQDGKAISGNVRTTDTPTELLELVDPSVGTPEIADLEALLDTVDSPPTGIQSMNKSLSSLSTADTNPSKQDKTVPVPSEEQ